MAREFQSGYKEAPEGSAEHLIAFPLYMKACAAGHTLSCTNSAATALNGIWPEGTAPILAQSDDCQIASYLIDCTDDGDSLGCSQLSIGFPAAYPEQLRE